VGVESSFLLDILTAVLPLIIEEIYSQGKRAEDKG
jgi:hypothetical protein